MPPRRHLPHILLLSCLATALLLAVSAWPEDQNAPGVLHISTRVVNVNVVVTAADGSAVRDLTQDDFTLLDGPESQKIAFFEAVDNGAPPPAPPPAPDTYTNRPEQRGAVPSVTVLLFDTLNSRWVSQGNALRGVRALLRQIQPQDHLGIYVLGEQLKVVHDATRDASDLVDAIGRYDEKHSHAPAQPAAGEDESTGNPGLDAFLAGKDNRNRFEHGGRTLTPGYKQDKLEFDLSMTAAALEAIARELSSFQGRKSLVWVSSSLGPLGYFLTDDLGRSSGRWPGYATTVLQTMASSADILDLERMIRLMNAAGIAVYTVDARGLETRNIQPNDAMLDLSSRTGGRSSFNTNELESGIRRALDDSRFSYSLAYYPTHNKWKGEWRKIQVKVNRPGVTVLSRGGYFALPDASPVRPKDRIEFLSQIAASPLESTQVPLSVHMAVSSAPNGARLTVLVHLDVLPMLTRQKNGRWAGNFELMFMQLGDKEKLLDATQKDVNADLTPERFEALAKQGLDLPVDLKLMPGATMLCVILHDKSTEAVGSVRIPLTRYSAALVAR
jgi:VWFA-related protein